MDQGRPALFSSEQRPFPDPELLGKDGTGASNEREMGREQQTERHWKNGGWIRCGSWNGKETSYKLPSRLVVPSRVQNASSRREALTGRRC